MAPRGTLWRNSIRPEGKQKARRDWLVMGDPLPPAGAAARAKRADMRAVALGQDRRGAPVAPVRQGTSDPPPPAEVRRPVPRNRKRRPLGAIACGIGAVV